MAVSSFSRSTVTSNLPRFNDMLVTNEAIAADAFQLIDSQIVGSGGTSEIVFSNIPQTYRHLQIRSVTRSSTSAGEDNFRLRFNNDSSGNYIYHFMYATGSLAYSSWSSTGATFIQPWAIPGATLLSGSFGVNVTDIYDYASTAKNKVIRAIGGYEDNGGSFSRVALTSGVWLNTAAVTTIRLSSNANLVQHSVISLYGVR